MAEINIKGITVGERLLIDRRRSGESQEAVANRLGIHRNDYGRIERDVENVCSRFHIPEVGELTKEEICFLLRRRAGLTQEACADEIGVTRFWFNQMEIGKAPSAGLIKFWESR